jgi:hypothetical protein
MNLFRIGVGLFAISALASLASYSVAIPSAASRPDSEPSSSRVEDPAALAASVATPEYVAAKEREIKAYGAQIARLNRQISEAEVSVPKLRARQPFLSDQIDELRSSLPGIEREIEIAEKNLLLAEQQQKSFDETIQQRKAGAVREADKRAKDQYRKKVEELEIARNKRYGLRRKRGAHRPDQSEVQYELNHRRGVKQDVEAKYAHLARIANSRLDIESAKLADSVASALDRIATAGRHREDALAQIKSASEELALNREQIDVVPIRIASLRDERESLVEVQRRSENDLRAAKFGLREKEALYVAAWPENSVHGLLQTDGNRSWAAPPANYATQNNTVGGSLSGSPRGYAQPYGVGQYCDYRYRPPVGEHFVNGHFRWNGTYVRGHLKTNSDNSFWNNWSSRGNVNPYTGHVGTKLPRLNSYHRSSFARGYGLRGGY